MTSITITTTRSISAERIAEARADIEKLNNPRHLMTFNDGYYANSLERKWGMGIGELAAIVRQAKRDARAARKTAAAAGRRASMREMG